MGLGGFHKEKVIIASCGKYLGDTGVDSIFVENKVYRQENVKSVMNGGNYVRGMRGMAILSEVLYSQVFNQFLFEVNDTQQVNQQVSELGQLILNTNTQCTE